MDHSKMMKSNVFLLPMKIGSSYVFANCLLSPQRSIFGSFSPFSIICS
jgi:hypothetical protein